MALQTKTMTWVILTNQCKLYLVHNFSGTSYDNVYTVFWLTRKLWSLCVKNALVRPGNDMTISLVDARYQTRVAAMRRERFTRLLTLTFKWIREVLV